MHILLTLYWFQKSLSKTCAPNSCLSHNLIREKITEKLEHIQIQLRKTNINFSTWEATCWTKRTHTLPTYYQWGLHRVYGQFLGVHISEDLIWAIRTSTLIKKVLQHICFLRSFHHCTILTNCFSMWFGGCLVFDWKALHISLVPSYPPSQTLFMKGEGHHQWHHAPQPKTAHFSPIQAALQEHPLPYQ